jgi:phage gpG-like protein
MILNVVITGDRELIRKFESMPAAVRSALAIKVQELALRLEAYIKTSKLDGQVLRRITGRLSRSISNKVMVEEDLVLGTVFSSGDVKYAAIHEFGGQTSPHIIEPKNASVLAFMMNGKQVFARRVHHPGSKMPERSFMRSSLRDMSEEISLGMKESVVQAIQQAVH